MKRKKKVSARLKRFSLTVHLNDLRKKIVFLGSSYVIGFMCLFPFSSKILRFLIKPILNVDDSKELRIIYTELTEMFTTELKVLSIASIYLILPIILYQIYSFIKPGLYQYEKHRLKIYLLLFQLLFLIGTIIAYYIMLPLACNFFTKFQYTKELLGTPIYFEVKIASYIDLVTKLCLTFALAFEFPIILLVLVKSKVLSIHDMKEYRRYFIVIIFIIAAIATPPDVLSQILLALPLILLYEISILICKLNNNA